ncbi:hypothetical protein OOK39_45635 [Streptomyces sp. NBC_00264]|nr:MULTISPECIES: hypothetical protein [unclassified Streptomyces]MCX5166314.1 hypothetical protein [Streptomyces sp. NBC_00305]MCX5224831.1 hypothetical protein [Streptomyces sp. NBC_00264]WSC25309.1 hypothetical protein OG902_00405 [Streptomyces sp. NBC_01768]WSW99024.1 hypothetical protein OG355_00135 [Streptomyces sp. NBC_00987]
MRPDGAVDAEADSYLRTHEGSGSQKTYAYFLVDHLRWRSRERLTTATAEMTDLLRYMGAVGAMTAMPWGQPWRVPPQRPYGQSALQIAAACLKGFYLHSCSEKKVNEELRAELGVRRLPTQMDRSRAMLGHMVTSMPANPLAPRGTGRRRHPKMPPKLKCPPRAPAHFSGTIENSVSMPQYRYGSSLSSWIARAKVVLPALDVPLRKIT